MRDYGRVHSSFWSSPTIATLSDDAKVLALYLMTSSHTTITGVFRLPDGYISEDLNWSTERVREGFQELLDKGFANRCETTKWVWIVKHLIWNPPENPNQRKAAAKVGLQVPTECGWKRAFMRVCGPMLGLEPMAETCESETLSKPLPEPFRNQKQEQEQEQEQDKRRTVPPPNRSDAVDPPPESLVLEIVDPGPAEPKAVATIPLVDGTDYPVTQAMVDEWAAAFPAVDVVPQLLRMRVWCNANKPNRKTARGVQSFVIKWLAKQQDQARKTGADAHHEREDDDAMMGSS